MTGQSRVHGSKRLYRTARSARTLSGYMSVITAAHRPAVTHPDTRRDQGENGPPGRVPQLAGRFRWWWQVLGSNQGRRSRRFFRPLSSNPSHTPLTSTYTLRGGIRGRRRPPCVRAPGIPGNSHGPRTGKRAATDGRGGSGYADRPPGFPALQPLRRRQDRWRGTADYGASICGRYPGAPYGVPISGPRCAGSGLLQSEPSLGGCVRTEAALPVLVATCVHWRSSSR